MSVPPSPMSVAFAMARQPGPATPPASFLARAAAGPAALVATDEDDEALFAELHGTFDFIRLSPFTAPSASQMVDWAALLRWLVAEFGAWSDTADPEFRRLRALLAVTIYINEAGDPWAELAIDLVGAAGLQQSLARFVGGVRLEAHHPESAPDWERQTVARFVAADRDQDWEALDKILPSLMPAFRPPWMLTQASWGLSFLNPPALVQATAGVDTMLSAIATVRTLPLDHALALAGATANERIRFAVVNQRLRHLRVALPPALEACAIGMLASIGADLARWSTWMRACFRYPRAYPALMTPLGAAMSRLPNDRFESLLEVLPLEDVAGSRPLVASVFEAFAGLATPGHRMAIWASAYDRWMEWGFEGYADGAARSTLDYAVVGHLVEGMTPAQRRAAGRDQRKARTVAKSAWYGDRSELQQVQYRLASARLVHIWARNVASMGVVWLDPRPPEMPRAFRSSYRDLRYNVH